MSYCETCGGTGRALQMADCPKCTAGLDMEARDAERDAIAAWLLSPPEWTLNAENTAARIRANEHRRAK